MEGKKIGLTTLCLLLLIVIIIIMGFIIFKIYNEKVSAESKVSELNEQITTLESTASALQQKINTISNTINDNKKSQTSSNEENNNTQKISLDKEYNNSGITFSYPSSFSKREDGIESLIDSNNNQIVIIRNKNSTIEKQIEDIKNTTTPDGSIFNTDIKEEGYIKLNNGLEGYKMQMISGGYNNIRFITEKDNMTFCFSFTIDNNSDKDKYEEIYEEIIKTISIK